MAKLIIGALIGIALCAAVIYVWVWQQMVGAPRYDGTDGK